MKSFGYVLALLLVALPAGAITITYVNPVPNDSRVFVGFTNNSTGNTTSDLVADPAAYSRNDTLFGPSAPPAADSEAYSGAELGTNLNAPLGTGVRSVFGPFNPSFFFSASGFTYTAAGIYSADAFAFSGNASTTSPTPWIIHVDPSGSEVAGTPADVTVSASIAGTLTVAGASVADASWNVATTAFGTVISGSASQSVVGSSNFSDSNTITFSVPLGSTFELLVDYDLTASGSGSGASSSSEITSSLVQISAAIPPMFAPVSGAKLLMFDKYTKSGKAKVVLQMTDPGGNITKGASADPPGLSGQLLIYQQSNPTNRAVFDLDAASWKSNKDSVAKYINKTAASGQPGVKVATVKPDKLIKVVAMNLGDGDSASGDQDANDLDLSVLTPSDVVMAVLTIDNANDSSTHRMCAQFESPTIKSIAGGSGFKYLSKTSSLPTSCPE
jgi:hypothetical protein